MIYYSRIWNFYLLPFIFYLLPFSLVIAQTPANDNCSNASLLCPNTQLSSNNINATPQCAGGPDGDCGFGTWCFTVENSVWFKFVTNDLGGTATISASSFTGSLDGVLLSSSLSCDISGYLIIDCKSNVDTSLSLNSSSLLPNTVYWVMIDGTSANQTNFQIAVFGGAVEWDLSNTITKATCDNSCDGSATITPQDGTSPYSYLWSPGVCTGSTCTGLCPGAYNVTVTDSIGCVALTTVTIDTLPPATVTITSTDEQCSNSCNGTATATLSSGQTPYSYAWNTSPAQTGQTATGLCKDTFTVTVTDALGCDTTSSVIINTLPSATISISSTDAQCPCSVPVTGSGTATATLSSGPSPISYLWNTNPVQTAQTATGLCPGTYSVTVTDSVGCDTSATVTIDVLPPATATITPVMPCEPACSSTATASLSSGPLPYLYNWSNGQSSNPATGLCDGTYSVTITDSAGCDTMTTVTILQPDGIDNVTVTATDVKCGNMGTCTASVAGGTEPYTYQWSNNNTTSGISDLPPGTYSVTVTDANNCTGTSEGTVSEKECDEELVPEDKFSPNGDGINDQWIIQNAEKFPDNKVMVFNRWGQKVYSTEGYDNVNKVWEGKLIPDAIYFYVIYEDKKEKKENVKHGSVTILR